MKITYSFTVTEQITDKEHLYPTFILARIAKGIGTYRIGGIFYDFHEGDIFFLNNLNSRKIVQIKEGPIIIDLFTFSPSQVKRRPKIISAFYSQDFNSIKYSFKQTYSNILDVLKTVLTTENNEKVSELLLDSFFSLLEDDLPDSLPSHMNSRAFKAANYIWENYAQDLYLEDIAKHLNVSKSHLEKLFKASHGVSVGEYIRLIRVHQAVLMMQEHPEKNVLDIAFSCGFTSSSGFYKAFKAVRGATPLRKNLDLSEV